MNRIRQPFNVNSLSLVAATVALNDDAYLEKTKQLNDEGMTQLLTGFEKMGLASIPSKGNFITVDVETRGDDVFEALLQRGVIVRPVSNYGLPQHLRVSIGLKHENERFLVALAEILGRTW
jgi:histidinol-phosphate aminotransferase